MIDFKNEDCMELMSRAKDKQWDLAIVDPPYGIAQDGHRENARTKLAKCRTYHPAVWDQSAPGEEWFRELRRVSKNQIIWGANHLGSMPISPCWVVWDKQNGENHFADCELAWTSFDTAVRQFTFRWAGMLQGDMANKEDRIHPTQKPVALYKWLLKNYAKPGDKILDTHGGSLSIGIACHDYGFDLTACELDKDYYEAAMKRLRNHQAQLSFV